MNLLTRDEFRNRVFARDNKLCVICSAPAIDAHHIIERRLWTDGGYYIDNGVSVCKTCHLLCEMTLYSVEEIREKAKITNKVLPPHLYSDEVYDKWGNIILSNGQRLRGELFNDDSIKKILLEGGVLHKFTHWVKYPRTYHLPWSEDIGKDDRILSFIEVFNGEPVIVSEKMDGENTTMYSDHIHARSVIGNSHPTRDWVKNFWSKIRHEIPEGWRICGENLYAKHSIKYNNLSSYFMGFSIWNDRNKCLSWNETELWFELLGIIPVPVLYNDYFNEQKIKKLWDSNKKSEGYIIRLAAGFDYINFKNSVAKFVRKGHVQTSEHWLHGKSIERNILNDK